MSDNAISSPRPRAPWWMYLLAASFLGFFALMIYNELWGVEPVGAFAQYGDRGMVLAKVLRDSSAQRAGLKPGDRVEAVDGQRVGNQADWFAIRTNMEPGRPVTLLVERDGKPVTLTLTAPQQFPGQWTQDRWMFFLTIRGCQFVALILALFIALSRPHDLIALVGAAFLAGVSVSNPVPPYGLAALLRHLPAPLSGLLFVAGFVGPSLTIALFLTFAAIFPQRLFRARWAWLLAWAPALFLMPWVFRYSYLTVYEPGHTSGVVPSWWLVTTAWIALAYVAAGVAALVLNYRRLKEANERRRVRVVVAGLSVGWLPGIPLILYLYVFPGSRLLGAYFSSTVSDFANLLYLAIPFAFTYAILRHRLFDIRVMVRQGLQYALARHLVLSLVPVLAVVLLLDLLLHADQPLINILQARGWVYVALGGLALTAHLQRQRWMEGLDRRFFRERYDAQRLLREVVEVVREAQSCERVAPRVVAQIEAALHPEFAALLVREPRELAYRILAAAPAGQAPPPLPAESKLAALIRVLGKPLEVAQTESGWLQQQLPREETDFLRRARMDLLVPVATSPERTEALLALGIKRSEEPYSREDQDLLVAIAASLALLLDRPAVAPAAAGTAFEECPQCGTCYDSGAGRCAREGAALTRTLLPRLLADRYLLERRLGRGGMGTVYQGTDTALERRVAAKVIRDELVGSAEAAERFRREARAAASFSHPNVVTVFDFGVAAGTRAFLVMELLEGSSLREELRRQRRLSASRALYILRGVCAAVEAAHRRQLLHRDLKPENIFLARNETGELAKVLDFGVAKFLPADTQATVDTGTAGILVGTLRYMSPEQLRGEPAEAAWDLWALGVVSYEMLTGRHPFERPSAGDLQRAVLAGRFTPLPESLPDAPARCQDFFARAFALEPERRPASADIFLSELERTLA